MQYDAQTLSNRVNRIIGIIEIWKINNLGALSVLMARINLKKNKSALGKTIDFQTTFFLGL